ncbi:MAG: hypothetical protein DRR16_16540 [Candidatus Parabeggiatoa sp. nov. 3]|nr:MAG: hypothetical protein DRR00_21300 [Gammaproteobacteria bacterium]RKZ62943.1 MAG: hypothetical protein DRQ99_17920 [Gammaproteobacteria bacterium]RKZ83751.1 MAG: hypothetical protein DRR16_16540 [Gammaproteobacteria bacterium]
MVWSDNDLNGWERRQAEAHQKGECFCYLGTGDIQSPDDTNMGASVVILSNRLVFLMFREQFVFYPISSR